MALTEFDYRVLQVLSTAPERGMTWIEVGAQLGITEASGHDAQKRLLDAILDLFDVRVGGVKYAERRWQGCGWDYRRRISEAKPPTTGLSKIYYRLTSEGRAALARRAG